MGLTLNTNSWVTVTESDTYFLDRWGSVNWHSLTNTEKERLLVTSFRWIQAQPQFSISASSTSDIVKNAQMELAWYIYRYFTETEKRRALYAQGVRRFSLSKWSETLEEGGFPNFITDMLGDELINLGGYFPTVSRDIE